MAKTTAKRSRKTKTTPYDVAEHLRTPDEMAAYLDAWLEEASDDPAGIARALGDYRPCEGHGSSCQRRRDQPRKSLPRLEVRKAIPASQLSSRWLRRWASAFMRRPLMQPDPSVEARHYGAAARVSRRALCGCRQSDNCQLGAG